MPRLAVLMDGPKHDRMYMKEGAGMREPGFRARLLRIPRLEPGALVIVVFAMAAFVMAQLYDPDYFWHLRTGQLILDTRALPSHDPFSFTRPDAPWVLNAWLFDVMLYSVYSIGGAIGVRLLVAILMGATFCVVYRSIRAFLNPVPALLIAVVCFSALLSFASPRGQVISYLFYAIYLHVILGFLHNGVARRLNWLPPIMILWVNCHGGYATGLILLTIVTSATALSRWLAWPDHNPTRLRPLLICLVITAGASLVSPYHIHHWLYPFQTAGLEATQVIAEWRSPMLKDRYFQSLVVLGLAYGWSVAFRDSRPKLEELLLSTAMLLLSMKAIRHVPFGVITLALLLALALADGVLSKLTIWWQRSRVRNWYKETAGRGEPLGSKLYVMNWLVLCTSVLLGLAYWPTLAARQMEARNELTGWKAVDFVISRGIAGRVFNEYGFGGLMIYRLDPAQKVFIDGRADAYGDAFVKEYLKIYSGQEGWEEAFDRYEIDYVVCARNAPVRQLLLQRGDFVSVYKDEYNSVLVKRIPRFESIIHEADDTFSAPEATGAAGSNKP
jgi:hypothetical protein